MIAPLLRRQKPSEHPQHLGCPLNSMVCDYLTDLVANVAQVLRTCEEIIAKDCKLKGDALVGKIVQRFGQQQRDKREGHQDLGDGD